MPIIKFVETTSNLAFDISFDVANGPQAAESVRQLMHELPPMKPLVLVMKIFLQQREFNEVGSQLPQCPDSPSHPAFQLGCLQSSVTAQGELRGESKT